MENATFLIKAIAIAGFWLGLAVTFLSLLTYVVSLVVVAFNIDALLDIGTMVQMWLPFNLNVILTWVVVMTSTYGAYKLSLFAYKHVSSFFNR